MYFFVVFFSKLAYNNHSVCVAKRFSAPSFPKEASPIQPENWTEHYNELYVERQLKSQNKHDSTNELTLLTGYRCPLFGLLFCQDN